MAGHSSVLCASRPDARGGWTRRDQHGAISVLDYDERLFEDLWMAPICRFRSVAVPTFSDLIRVNLGALDPAIHSRKLIR